MNKILIVEDDKNIQDILAFNLERNDYQVFTTESGAEAIEILKEEEDISLVLMDVMLPKMNGFDCTVEIRKFTNIPIIMITALEDESNVLKGFECGVNDYVIKPFSIREVLARVKTQLRVMNEFSKNSKELKDNKFIKINNIELNTIENSVVVNGKENELTNTEYNLLMFFYNHPNKVFERKQILEKVWGTTYGDLRTVDVTIRRLREKIEVVDSDPQNIKTRRGKGYYLELK